MVAVGETLTLPLVGSEPMPLSIVTEVALLVDHVKVELWPELMLAGLAVNEIVGAGVVATFTVAVALEVPPGPVAVRV